MHTPGPWRLPRPQRKSNFGARRIVIDNWPRTPRRYIAEVPYREPNPEAEANARLIAAAPDLLAACIAARVALQDYGLQQAPGYIEAQEELDATLKAALAKARSNA